MGAMNSEYLSYAETTKAFLTEEGALGRLPELIKKLAVSEFGGKRRFGIIADTHTQEAAGKALSELLESQNLFPLELAEPLIYPGSPILHADYKYIPEIVAYIRKNDCVPIAVGSGTINDLVKRAAYEAGTPYIVAATAASVDGYASDGAALLENGMKHTKPCPAPTIIIADTDILEQAPEAMGAAGYADLIAKIPAGGDWILADALQEDPIEATAWHIVQHNLREWVSVPGDMEKVFSGLTASGIAMQYLKRSRPVSGAEHLFSHIWEMEGLTYRGETVSHGFKVGIGSLLSTALMEIFQKLTITPQITEAAERCYPS
ncbi:MAG: iron-containing alcohol dehydrogenase, partial [Spirochaetales bacterium]|nr:iron-containing alcohol dehydrogenase [Spirochaetales bacterium]